MQELAANHSQNHNKTRLIYDLNLDSFPPAQVDSGIRTSSHTTRVSPCRTATCGLPRHISRRHSANILSPRTIVKARHQTCLRHYYIQAHVRLCKSSLQLLRGM